MKQLLLSIVLCLALVGTANAQGDMLQVVATTTIIADVARNVGGDLVNVTALIPPGQDVHTFTPSPADVGQIVDADLVLVNGAFLEEGLLEIVETNAGGDIVIVSNGVAVIGIGEHRHEEQEENEHSLYPIIGHLGEDAQCEEGVTVAHHADDGEAHDHGPCDPHFWTDPANVIIWANNIADAFAAADPDRAETYRANADAYIAQLEAVQDEIAEMVAAIPEANRILVTNHEFLAYFAAAYGFEIVGTVVPSASTLAEVDPRTLADLIEVIRAENVPAIFAEISANTDLAETVAAEVGHAVQIVTLYSDSLSDSEGPASTYLDYIRYNARLIVEALGGDM